VELLEQLADLVHAGPSALVERTNASEPPLVSRRISVIGAEGVVVGAGEGRSVLPTLCTRTVVTL
jgi:hypothetical protein